MKSVPTFTATIHVGTKSNRETPSTIRSVDMARGWLQRYVDATKFCVSLTETEYLYTFGSEQGFIVGIINYPRFPSDPASLRVRALEIAEGLRDLMNQYKVTIVFPDDTVMIEAAE